MITEISNASGRSRVLLSSSGDMCLVTPITMPSDMLIEDDTLVTLGTRTAQGGLSINTVVPSTFVMTMKYLGATGMVSQLESLLRQEQANHTQLFQNAHSIGTIVPGIFDSGLEDADFVQLEDKSLIGTADICKVDSTTGEVTWNTLSIYFDDEDMCHYIHSGDTDRVFRLSTTDMARLAFLRGVCNDSPVINVQTQDEEASYTEESDDDNDDLPEFY